MYLTSKMSEKQIHNQTKDYLYRNKLLYIYQSAFRANHSTDTYLSQLTLTDMILNSAENGKHTLMILINLQMVFGTLEYKILSDKIKHMSCSDKATKQLFHAYLKSRTFFVSLARTINCRIWQRSKLRPLLYLLYINYIPQALSDSHTYLYVDDTSIFYQQKDVTKIENVLSKEFVNVQNTLAIFGMLI